MRKHISQFGPASKTAQVLAGAPLERDHYHASIATGARAVVDTFHNPEEWHYLTQYGSGSTLWAEERDGRRASVSPLGEVLVTDTGARRAS